MNITEHIMKQTYEETIDKHIEQITKMQKDGLKEESDILLLDTCLKCIIVTSNIRSK